MHPRTLIAAAALSTLAAATNAATIIPATGDIFLATQQPGSSVSGNFGSDYAPANSPVQFAIASMATVTVSATGMTSVDDSCFAGPDGGCYSDESSFSPAPASGTYKGPANALIGVFEGPGVTIVANGPASLDYTMTANQNLVSQSPVLNQIFFIGDGMTDTAVIQQFVAPLGATSLFLATADSIGASTGNAGSLSIDITGATPVLAAPEPATWGLMLVGFGLVGGMARARGRRLVA